MLRVVRRIDSLRGELRAGSRITAFHRKVAVQFKHQGSGCHGVRTVNLYLVVVLRLRTFRTKKEQKKQGGHRPLEPKPRLSQPLQDERPSRLAFLKMNDHGPDKQNSGRR